MNIKLRNAEATDLRRALVVFSGRADLPWQRLLRPGYRHCSLILEDRGDWLLVEPLATQLQVRRIGGSSGTLANRLRGAGFRVIETQTAPNNGKVAPLALWTCVETVKRGLGIHSLFIQTPWQLCQFLELNMKISLDSRR